MTLTNYIPDTNPFQLAGPPQWFLRKLWDYDPSLVIVASRQGHYYRLTQRRHLDLPEHMTNDMLFKESDTQMLSTYGLVPITTILATANWSNPFIFVELTKRAPWRMGGADKYHDMVEAQDNKEEFDRRLVTTERNHELAKDGWKLYNKKIGLRGTYDLGKLDPRAEKANLILP